MDKKFLELKLPDGLRRYRIIYTDDVLCELDTQLARSRQDLMLSDFFGNYSLRICGPIPFQKFKMGHNGQVWTIELEAEETLDEVDPSY